MDEDTGEWSQTKKVFASDGRTGDQFGCAVSISSDYFVVGARSKTAVGGESFAGAAYVYELSGTWTEIDKLENVNESSIIGNNFGHSVCIENDHIIIGSPEARGGKGVVDIFRRTRGWSHLKKLLLESLYVPDDRFGYSVSIFSSIAAIGSIEDNDVAPNAGAAYVYEDPEVVLRLAQQFDIDGEFVPSKASMYLKRIGKNDRDYFLINNSSENVIDVTNFKDITSGLNKVYLGDTISNFTGSGYMILESNSNSTFDVINYPIRASEDDTFDLWIRCISLQSNNFSVDILLDGNLSKTIDVEINDPSISEWTWVSTTMVIPDTSTHILGIKIKERQAAIDKIYIDADSMAPYNRGPDYSLSPYVTTHVKLYKSNSKNSPTDALFVYDYKNTIDHIVVDDWYNFNIKVMDNNHGFTEPSDFIGDYYIVLSSSGGSYNNFIVWEFVDNDEYLSFPSAIRFNYR